MEACGCGGAVPGSRRSDGQPPTVPELKFHFKSHSSGNLHVRPRLSSSPLCPSANIVAFKKVIIKALNIAPNWMHADGWRI